MRPTILALLASLAFASSASATFTRVSDTGGAGYETSYCVGPPFNDCFFSTVGTGPIDLQAPSDQVDFSYLGGSLQLRTTFEPTRIHTEFDGTRFDMSQPPCGVCYWDYFNGAGTKHGERTTTFTVSDPTPVHLFGNLWAGDLLAFDGPGGTLVYSYGPDVDETLMLDPGQYRLNLLMPVMYGSLCCDVAGGERITFEVVPEPSTLVPLGVGLAGLAVARRGPRRAISAR